MNKLIESYKTLFYLNTQVQFFIEIHLTYMANEESLNEIKFKGHYSNIPFAKAISGNLLNYTLILANSFFDEYNKEFTSGTHPEFKDRINNLKLITKPVMQRVNKWKDLKDFRNYILAHGFRVKNKSLFAKGIEPKKFIVPHTDSEIILLVELMKVITTCISNEFPELVEKLDWSENLSNKMSIEIIEVDVKQELNEIWTKVNAIKGASKL